MGIDFQSDKLAAGDRVAIWHDVICRSYVPLDVTLTSQKNFAGTVSTNRLASVRIATSSSTCSQRVTRTPRLIREDTHDYLMVGISAGPGIVQQHGRVAQLSCGSFTFWDTRYPYDIVFPDDWRMKVFQFPRDAFGFSDRFVSQLTAVPVAGDHGIGRVVSTFMDSLADEAKASGVTNNVMLKERAVSLLSMAIQQELTESPVETSHLLENILEYINVNLSNPNLSAPMIAVDHGISLRTLHRLFSQTGQGVSERIRISRLENIRNDLADPHQSNYTIGAIARRWGILNTSNFSRTFKSVYGTTPREYCGSFSAHKID